MRISRGLHLATYGTIGVMYVIGAMSLPTVGQRLIAAGLSLAFGLVYALGLERLFAHRQAAPYFLIQSALVVGLLALRSHASEAFAFLFFLLTIQAALRLTLPQAVAWTACIFVVMGLTDYVLIGPDSLIQTLFYVPIYVLSVALGHTLRTTELARQHSQQLLAELRAAQRQLSELAAAKARTRMARELHNSLGHRLTVAVVQFEGAQRLIPVDAERAARIIGSMRDEMKEALAELRQTVTAWRTPAGLDQPPESAVARLAETFQKNTGLATHFTAAQLPALPTAYRLAFFRAAQEALTNVQRHAAARNVWLALAATESDICLTVDDDGRGLPSPPPHSGSGLIGLRERAADLGGQFEIARRAGGGTSVRFSVPRPEAAS